MSNANGPRKTFLDWNLLYLYSFDIELDTTREERLGQFPGEFRITLFARDDLSRAYNIGREPTVRGNGRPSIRGKIKYGHDRAHLRDDDIAMCHIQYQLQTDDGAKIDVEYRLFGYVGPGGVARVVSGVGKDQFGTENHPYEVPIVTSPRFQTNDPKYAWMNTAQGIGFGRAVVIRSKFRRNTQDFYVLT
jgi:hypothetical protein